MSAFENARNKLGITGFETSEIILPESFGKLAAMHADIMACETAKSLAFEYAPHRESLSEKLRERIEVGKSVSLKSYDSALEHAAKCRRLLGRVFRNVDIILAPSAPGEAPAGLSFTGDPIFNCIWTLLHVPCVNIPAFRGSGGLPVGIQAVGRFGDDRRVLAAAGRIIEVLTA